MDTYDYDEEHLSMVAGNCRHHSYKQMNKSSGYASAVSCADCKSWTGTGCKRGQFENISSELQLD